MMKDKSFEGALSDQEFVVINHVKAIIQDVFRILLPFENWRIHIEEVGETLAAFPNINVRIL